MNITAFLLARIAEDEKDAIDRVVLRAEDRRSLTMDDAEKIHAEIAAKRALCNLHSPGDYRGQLTCNDCGDWWDGTPIDYPCETVKIVAAVYADHKDYDPAWSPNAR